MKKDWLWVRVISLGTGIALGAASPGAVRAQGPNLAMLETMIGIAGSCPVFELQGIQRPCNNGALYQGYRNGRGAVMVNGEAKGALWVLASFSGKAAWQGKREDLVLTVDRILLNTETSGKEISASGTCRMKLVSRRIEGSLTCEATDEGGSRYRLEVLPGGKPVSIKRF